MISCVYNNASGRWEAAVIDLDFFVQSMIEEPDGTLWLGSPSEGVVSISSPGTPNRIIKKYSGDHGLPLEEGQTLGEIDVARIANQTVFATQHGLYRFDTTMGRFVPHPILGKDSTGALRANSGRWPVASGL